MIMLLWLTQLLFNFTPNPATIFCGPVPHCLNAPTYLIVCDDTHMNPPCALSCLQRHLHQLHPGYDEKCGH